MLSDPLIIARVKGALLPRQISDGTDEVKREGQRCASVLMPLVMRPDIAASGNTTSGNTASGWQVILTQRPMSMARHAGQISFPGGKRERGESAQQAALRETHEEVGIAPADISVLGRLPSFNAVSEYRVTPFVGVVAPHTKIIRDEREVEAVFEVPLSFVLNPDNHIPRTAMFDGREHQLYDMPYTELDGTHRNIWGMTAMIMRRLYERGFS